ncbi:hypothetical protein ASU33_16890 [Solirubrum puertoriconensis]|uniref:Uncharacterized protein n=1 Tax=Solirubrum puertoriconensis TaxID=1751427 RepID=A0A9X0HNP8_SOLP1|nr:hypothetical protein ASU33_16890 [Solirubrum puertoriconensis]
MREPEVLEDERLRVLFDLVRLLFWVLFSRPWPRTVPLVVEPWPIEPEVVPLVLPLVVPEVVPVEPLVLMVVEPLVVPEVVP